jgi:hypothetical protein
VLKKTIEVHTESGRVIEVGCVGDNFYIQIGKASAELLPSEAGEVVGALREVSGASYSPPIVAARPAAVRKPNTPDYDYPINPQ